MKKEDRLTNISMLNFVRNNFSWVKDAVVVIGVIALMYLQGHYVTVEKFEANSRANDAAHTTLITTLASMDKTLALMGRNQSDISNLEAQVKINTRTLVEVSAQNKIDAEYNNLFKESSVRLAELIGRVNNLEAYNINNFMKESAVNRAQMDIRIKTLETIHPHQVDTSHNPTESK